MILEDWPKQLRAMNQFSGRQSEQSQLSTNLYDLYCSYALGRRIVSIGLLDQPSPTSEY